MSALLEHLVVERTRSKYRLRFSTSLEPHYRSELRKLLRLNRVILFLAIAAAFALAPFQEVEIFHMPQVLRGSLLLFAQTILPLAIVAAAFTYLRGPLFLTQALQIATVLGTLIAVLAVRRFALISEFQFPAGMLSITAIAIAVFGGFVWRPLFVVLLLFFGLAIAQEFSLTRTGGNAPLEAYQLSLAAVIALLASFSNEVLRRQNWLQKASATALSRMDVLTGMSNRADFERRIHVTLRQARRDKVIVALMILDIDHFKKINDRHGHAVGDVALRAFANAVDKSGAQRPLDIKARTGGEEFVLVWYDVLPEVLPKLVDRVMEEIRAIRVKLDDLPEPLKMTASAGVCCTLPDDATSPGGMLQRADALMYQAKQAGRNQACFEPYHA